MKPVIIIAIAFVLLIIPLQVYAQSSESSPGLLLNDIMVDIVGYFIIFIIPFLIILFTVLKIKGKLRKSLTKKILIGSGLSFLGIFLFMGFTPSFMSEDEKEIWDEEKHKREFKSLQESIGQRENEYYYKYEDEIWSGTDPRSLEKRELGELTFSKEWDDLDKLIEQQRSGKITQNQECQTIASLMNQNISDDYLYTFWHEAFLQECSYYDP